MNGDVDTKTHKNILNGVPSGSIFAYLSKRQRMTDAVRCPLTLIEQFTLTCARVCVCVCVCVLVCVCVYVRTHVRDRTPWLSSTAAMNMR